MAQTKHELRREIEAIFAVSAEIILIEPLHESGSELMLSNRTTTLKLKDVLERNAVRWETDAEYSFERVAEPTAQNSQELS